MEETVKDNNNDDDDNSNEDDEEFNEDKNDRATMKTIRMITTKTN